MLKISSVKAREILDSHGNPTVEVDIVLDNDVTGWAAVFSGASTDTRGTMELRDNDKSRFYGGGARTVVEDITKIITPKIVGVDVLEQWGIDQLLIALNGTENKSRLGVSAILGVSMAAARAAPSFLNIPLFKYIGDPSVYELLVPIMNILNGGKHADNTASVQEFMIVPIGADNFAIALRMYSEVYQTLKATIEDRRTSTAVGDGGGLAPSLTTNGDAPKLIVEVTERTGYRPGESVSIVLDSVTSELYMDGKYVSQGEKTSRSSEEVITFYSDRINKYPIAFLEGGLAENDQDGWAALTTKLGSEVQLVGDGIFVTNPGILQEGADKHITNSILIKLNQIDTLSETLDTIQMTHMAEYTTVVSRHSGETEDTIMVDMAVAVNTGQVRSGTPCRTERIARYNQLPRTEELLGDSARFSGVAVKR